LGGVLDGTDEIVLGKGTDEIVLGNGTNGIVLGNGTNDTLCSNSAAMRSNVSSISLKDFATVVG